MKKRAARKSCPAPRPLRATLSGSYVKRLCTFLNPICLMILDVQDIPMSVPVQILIKANVLWAAYNQNAVISRFGVRRKCVDKPWEFLIVFFGISFIPRKGTAKFGHRLYLQRAAYQRNIFIGAYLRRFFTAGARAENDIEPVVDMVHGSPGHNTVRTGGKNDIDGFFEMIGYLPGQFVVVQFLHVSNPFNNVIIPFRNQNIYSKRFLLKAKERPF